MKRRSKLNFEKHKHLRFVLEPKCRLEKKKREITKKKDELN